MRNAQCLFYLLVLGCLSVSAQTRSDLIYKLDKTSLSAIVDEIGETDITYFLPNDALKQRPQRMAKMQVWKIVFANGDTEIINELTQQTAPPAASIVPDRIHLTNKTVIEGSVTKIGEETVEYRRVGVSSGAPVLELSRQRITKIEYANGEVETLAATPPKSGEIKKEANKQSAESKRRAVVQEEKSPKVNKPSKTLTSRSTVRKEAKVGVSMAFVGSYIIKEDYWRADSNGVGLRQGVGGNISLNFKLSKRIWLSLQGGYTQFQNNRNYLTPQNDTLYSTKTSLTIIPIQVGFKIYLAKKVYLGLAGGMNYLTTKFDSYRDYSLQTKRFSPTATATLGVEPRIGKLKIDIGLQYNYATVNAAKNYEASPAIHIPQLKLGIGF